MISGVISILLLLLAAEEVAKVSSIFGPRTNNPSLLATEDEIALSASVIENSDLHSVGKTFRGPHDVPQLNQQVSAYCRKCWGSHKEDLAG